jgi:hypothetical protein
MSTLTHLIPASFHGFSAYPEREKRKRAYGAFLNMAVFLGGG